MHQRETRLGLVQQRMTSSHAFVKHLTRSLLDHHPILLSTSPKRDVCTVQRNFYMLVAWFQHKDFGKVVTVLGRMRTTLYSSLWSTFVLWWPIGTRCVLATNFVARNYAWQDWRGFKRNLQKAHSDI